MATSVCGSVMDELCDETPVMTAVPARRVIANACSIPSGGPDASSVTSAPRPSVSARTCLDGVAVRGVHDVGGAELQRDVRPPRERLHGDDPLGARELRALDHPQAQVPAAHDRDAVAGLHLTDVERRAHAGGDAAAQEASASCRAACCPAGRPRCRGS